MAVLKEANHLGLVPRSSPIGLTVTDARSRSFSVDLIERHLLLFRSAARHSGELDFSSIREILVLAVK